jgi:hypothetical protein
MIGQGADQSPDRKDDDEEAMVLEIGMGTDIRGADPTKAACRALRDALWHSGGEFTSAFGGVAEVHGRTASAAFDAFAE